MTTIRCFMITFALLSAGCTLMAGTRPAQSGTVHTTTPANGSVATTQTTNGQPAAANQPQASTYDSRFTLRQREYMETNDRRFNDAVADTNEACGYNLNASIDWVSFQQEIDRHLDGEQPRGMQSFCTSVLSRLRTICRDGQSEAVRARVQSYVCAYGGPNARSIELNNGVLRLGVEWEAVNYDPYVRDYIGRVL